MDSSTTGADIVPVAPSLGRLGTAPFALFLRDVWLQATIAIFVLVYCVSTFVMHPANGYSLVWDGWIYTIAETLPIVLMLLCATRWPAQRVPWLFISLGVLLHTIGDLIYTYHDQNLASMPSPAPSDFAYVFSYVAFIFGIVILTQGHLGRIRMVVRLEGIIFGLAVASVAALLWFGPVLQVSGGFFKVVVTLAYPIGNLVLLVLLVAALAPNHYRPNWPVMLLTVGVLWFVFGDIVYLDQGASGTFVSRSFLESTWVVGLWLTGLAASAVDRRRSGTLRSGLQSSGGDTWVPVASGLVFLGTIVAYLSIDSVSVVVLFLSTVGLGLVTVHAWLSNLEVQRAAHRVAFGPRTDIATGLLRVEPFLDQVDSWLSDDSPGLVGLVALDLDDFSRVNETAGYAIGDELLWVIGKRVEYRMGSRGVFARSGADEFVFAAKIATKQEIEELRDEVVGAVSNRFKLTGFSISVSASVGTAVTSTNQSSAAELFARATTDLRQVKARRTSTSS